MSQPQGVKETKEALVGLLALALVLAKHFKDGVQGKDFVAIYADVQSSPELKAKLEAAYEGYNLIDDELKDVSLAEAFELLQAATPEVLKLIEELRS